MKKTLITLFLLGSIVFVFGQSTNNNPNFYSQIDSFRYWGSQDADFMQACKIITMGGVYEGASIIMFFGDTVGNTFDHGPLHLGRGHLIFKWKDGLIYLAASGEELISFDSYTPVLDTQYTPEQRVAYAQQATGIHPSDIPQQLEIPRTYNTYDAMVSTGFLPVQQGVVVNNKTPNVRFWISGQGLLGNNFQVTNDPFRLAGYRLPGQFWGNQWGNQWGNTQWINVAPLIWRP